MNLGLSFSLSGSRLSASIQMMLTDNKHTELSHLFLICVFFWPNKNLKARTVVIDSLILPSLKRAGVWEMVCVVMSCEATTTSSGFT